jgi:hypothetical protein
MSVSIATMGMFQDCCGVSAYGGGAPSVPALAEKYEKDKFSVVVKKVYFEDATEMEKLKIIVKSVDSDSDF